MRYPYTDQTWLTWDASAYDVNAGPIVGWADSCPRPDKDFEPQPNAVHELVGLG